mgnify:FL=1
MGLDILGQTLMAIVVDQCQTIKTAIAVSIIDYVFDIYYNKAFNKIRKNSLRLMK